MGVYAESDIQITCKTKKITDKVFDIIKKKVAEFDKAGQIDGTGVFIVYDLDKIEYSIYGKMSSGRVQNLEYQCGVLWDLIKDIKGVEELNCPFLMEADGEYFSNEDNYNK